MARRPTTWVLALCVALSASEWCAISTVLADDSPEPGLFPAEELKEEIAPESTKAATVEIIRERYPNRAVKIEREVIRDAEDNYVNHGTWRMWDKQGNIVAEGQYINGKRDGEWTAWFMRGESKIFSEMPFKEFAAPFISRATFKEGELHGMWTLTDSKQRKVSEWEYSEGVRHGTWLYYFASGRKAREIQYSNGIIDGGLKEYTSDGKQITDDTYQRGRRLGRKVEHYTAGQKKSDGMYLYAQLVPNGQDDFWNMHLAPFVKRGDDQKHGEWRSWYPNGQDRVHGKYDHGVPSSEFTWSWWYSNGQKAVEGQYENGQKNERWIWWHDNGQKKIEGRFVMGDPIGKWIWWEDNGRVSQRVEYAPGNGSSIATKKSTGDKDVSASDQSGEDVGVVPPTPQPYKAQTPTPLQLRR